MDESFEEEKPRNLERKQKNCSDTISEKQGKLEKWREHRENFWNVYSISYLIELIQKSQPIYIHSRPIITN